MWDRFSGLVTAVIQPAWQWCQQILLPLSCSTASPLCCRRSHQTQSGRLGYYWQGGKAASWLKAECFLEVLLTTQQHRGALKCYINVFHGRFSSAEKQEDFFSSTKPRSAPKLPGLAMSPCTHTVSLPHLPLPGLHGKETSTYDPEGRRHWLAVIS